MDNIQNNTNLSNQPVANVNPYVNPYGKPIAPKPQKKIELQKVDYIFFGIFAVLSLCVVFFGFFGGMAIGFTISLIALVVTLVIYMFKNGDFTFISVASLVLAILSSVTFSLYAIDPLSRFLAFVIYFSSTTMCAVSTIDETVMDTIEGAIKYLRSVVVTPFQNILLPIKALLKNDKNKTAIQIGGAFLAAIPVLIIVVPLLTSADAAFEGLVGKIAESLGMTILKLIISVVLTGFLLAFAISCKYELNETNSKPINFEKARTLKSPFAVTFLGMIAFVYLVYMFSQTAYFFSAFSGILPAGYEFSFAQYARRGFFETEAIAFINLVLMGGIQWKSVRRDNGELNLMLKGIMTFISVFTILFIVTALSKMVMYIGEYGLTVLRLFTSVFMIATAVVIVAFIIRVFNPELDTMKYAVVIALSLFTVLCLCGVDRTVAHYNVNAYLSGMHESIDLYTLEGLSESSIPYIYKLTVCGDETIEKESKRIIYMLYDWYVDDSVVTYDETETKTYSATYKATYGFTLSEYFATKSFNKAEVGWYYDDYDYDTYYEDEQVIEDEVTVLEE
ncbi:MAG: DUF4173 domain-containing protein [Clostridia bacterium]|nr:DUF4173 domain-containing protein [Clostridia bacterium]